MSKYNLAELFKKHRIENVSSDSRKIKPNDAFFALKGKNFDGNKYIMDALRSGATIIFKELDKDEIITNELEDKIYYVDDIKKALITAIELFFPRRPKSLIAVTGTNGKTSIVSYCHQLLNLLGQKSATIGTLGIKCSDSLIENELQKEASETLNTLDVLSLRKILHRAANEIDYVIFEASSHGLDQQRLGNLKVQASALASFGHDHLDYHKTKENYLQAKLKLFSQHLEDDGLAVINKDTQDSTKILEFLDQQDIQTITIGKNGNLQITGTEQTLDGQKIEFSYSNKNYQLFVPIIGLYQASNLLIAALLVAKVTAEKNITTIDEIFAFLPKLKAAPGRLQKIKSDAYNIFIDYSHKPDALKSSLIELKKITPLGKKLVVVFGCGGDRDTEKRPIMGEVASDIANIVIVTDDNPRFEDPEVIRKAILTKAKNALEIGDRYKAIKKAIEILDKGDSLLIAGKGHERYQIIGDKKYDFDDTEVTRQILLMNDK